MSHVSVPITSFLFGLFPIVILGGIFGCRIFARKFPRPFHFLLGCVFALSIYSVSMTVLGLFSGLNHSLTLFKILCLLFILGILFLRPGQGWGGPENRLSFALWIPSDIQSRILMWIVIVMQILMLVRATAPYINQDAENSHYLFMKNYAETGGLSVSDENSFSYYPQATEMLVLNAFRLAGEQGPEAGDFCYWFMQLLLLMLLLDFCARRGKSGTGWHLVSAVSGIFYWPVIAYSGYVDGVVALFALAGIISYLDWLSDETENNKWSVALSAIFLGLACTSKYSALAVAGLVFLHFAWITFTSGRNFKKIIPDFLLFLILFIAAVAPWFGRNIALTGNPVFPFLRSIFGGPELTLGDDISTWSSWGLDVNLRNYIIYPIKLSFFYPLQGVPLFRIPYMYMHWLFALAPVSGLLLLHRRIERIVAVWCLIFFTFAFFVMNLQTRYFLAFTILALWLVIEWLTGFVSLSPAVELMSADKPAVARKRSIIKWIVFLLVLLPMATQLDLVRNHLVTALPYISGQMNRDEFERHVFPGESVFDAANENGSDENKICTFSLRTYRLRVPYFLPPDEIFSAQLSPDDVLNRLEAEGAGYLLVETRIRESGIILSWALDQPIDADGISIINENAFLDALGDRGVSRNLAREIIRHQGGVRYQENGTWFWRIDFARQRESRTRSILQFLANIDLLADFEKLEIVEQTSEWELYGIHGVE